MVGLIREGRSAEVRAQLIHGLADAWSEITGDEKENLAIFIVEMPGANVMEDGQILPEASEDAGATTRASTSLRSRVQPLPLPHPVGPTL